MNAPSRPSDEPVDNLTDAEALADIRKIFKLEDDRVTNTTLVAIIAERAITAERAEANCDPQPLNRAQRLLKAIDRVDPKVRFARMVADGLICPRGCVLAYGAYPCDPERHGGGS